MNSFTDGKPLDQAKPKQPITSGMAGRSTPRWGLFGFIVLLGLQIFLIYQVLGNKDQILESQDQVAALEEEMMEAVDEQEKQGQKLEQSLGSLTADFTVVRNRLGVTQKELNRARAAARRLREEQERSVQQLNVEIARKADSRQLSELKSASDSRFGAVNQDVSKVKTDVEATRKALEGARREIVDVRATLTQQIARNKDELKQLRLKGERNFYEFDIQKKKGFALVGDIRIGVTKTNRRRQRYNVRIVVDDNTLEKKRRTINEPVQFLVGPTKLRYELVVNEVRRNRIIGYLSVPKDKGLSAERKL
ncbi:MAG: hypothetical protein F4Z21_08335 [Acidobacteria bacterium]|nr:hypothetical protein [Acidobacteriota bacterium]